MCIPAVVVSFSPKKRVREKRDEIEKRGEKTAKRDEQCGGKMKKRNKEEQRTGEGRNAKKKKRQRAVESLFYCRRICRIDRHSQGERENVRKIEYERGQESDIGVHRRSITSSESNGLRMIFGEDVGCAFILNACAL